MTGALALRKAGRLAGAAALPMGMLILVALMVIPVSPTILDISFIGNIMISLAILMVALSASKPLDFSAFPTVLLLATRSDERRVGTEWVSTCRSRWGPSK